MSNLECSSDNCYTCNRDYCILACYNKSCSLRVSVSDMASNSCENAGNCLGYISKETIERRREGICAGCRFKVKYSNSHNLYCYKKKEVIGEPPRSCDTREVV